MRGIQGGIASAIRAGRATVDYSRLARRARCPCVTLSRPARRLSSKPRASEQAAENTRVSMLYADLESRVAEKVKEITRYNSQRVRDERGVAGLRCRARGRERGAEPEPPLDRDRGAEVAQRRGVLARRRQPLACEAPHQPRLTAINVTTIVTTTAGAGTGTERQRR